MHADQQMPPPGHAAPGSGLNSAASQQRGPYDQQQGQGSAGDLRLRSSDVGIDNNIAQNNSGGDRNSGGNHRRSRNDNRRGSGGRNRHGGRHGHSNSGGGSSGLRGQPAVFISAEGSPRTYAATIASTCAEASHQC